MDDQREDSDNFEGCYKGKPTKQLQADLSSTYVEIVYSSGLGRNIRILDERNLLPEEQKGCRKKERGTKVNSRSSVHCQDNLKAMLGLAREIWQ